MSEKVATGISQAVTEKAAGWVEFEIDVGSQYPVRLATKQSEIIELGRAAHRGGEKMDWLYTEKESDKINERSGKPFVNRYLNGVAPAGSTPESAADSVATPDAVPKGEVDWDAKERRDYRSRAWAQAISALTHTIKLESNENVVYQRIHRLQRLIYMDIVRELDPNYHPDHDVPFE